LDFAFVACNRNVAQFRQDPSFIYRCENVSAPLQEAGHRVAFLHLKSFPLHHRFDVVVFHRPRWSWRLHFLLVWLRNRKTVVVADVDDLIFDENLAEFSPAVLNGLLPLKKIKNQYRAHRKAFSWFRHITVSTNPLAEHAQKLFPQAQVEVLPNGVHYSWLKGQLFEDKSFSEPHITYFPGTRSHDRDFAVIADQLRAFLARHPRVRLQITGPLQFEVPARPGQVSHKEKVPFGAFSNLFRNTWVNLAPLEINPFTRCKSALKVIEAGCWNVPTICSPIPDTKRFEGAGALLGKSHIDWLDNLETLLDPIRYKEITAGLRDRVLQRADVAASAARLVEIVGRAREKNG
jgi:hypothetical protein